MEAIKDFAVAQQWATSVGLYDPTTGMEQFNYWYPEFQRRAHTTFFTNSTVNHERIEGVMRGIVGNRGAIQRCVAAMPEIRDIRQLLGGKK